MGMTVSYFGWRTPSPAAEKAACMCVLKGRTFRCAVKGRYFWDYEAASAAEVVSQGIFPAAEANPHSTGVHARLNRLPKKAQQQIPHRLKPVRDDKHKGLVTAQLKLRPFKTSRIRVFPPSVKACSTLDTAIELVCL